MNGDERTEPIDLEALDVGPMLRHARTATFAPNWKAVLLADATVGLAIIAARRFPCDLDRLDRLAGCCGRRRVRISGGTQSTAMALVTQQSWAELANLGS